MEKIISIKSIGVMDAVDIEVTGNHLFYANDILTHNSDSDFDMTSTSESFGLPATLDFLVGIIRTEELDALNQLMIKQLKSRYNDVNFYRKFIVGVEIHKFKLHDVEESQQRTISEQGKTDDDIPMFDKSRGSRDYSGIQFD